MKTSSFQISYRHCLSGVKKNKNKLNNFVKVFKWREKKKKMKRKFKTFLENIKKKKEN